LRTHTIVYSHCGFSSFPALDSVFNPVPISSIHYPQILTQVQNPFAANWIDSYSMIKEGAGFPSSPRELLSTNVKDVIVPIP